MQLDSWGWVWAPILIYVGGIAISLLLLYLVIRAAVTGALRDHQRWMDRTHPQPPTYTPLR